MWLGIDKFWYISVHNQENVDEVTKRNIFNKCHVRAIVIQISDFENVKAFESRNFDFFTLLDLVTHDFHRKDFYLNLLTTQTIVLRLNLNYRRQIKVNLIVVYVLYRTLNNNQTVRERSQEYKLFCIMRQLVATILLRSSDVDYYIVFGSNKYIWRVCVFVCVCVCVLRYPHHYNFA